MATLVIFTTFGCASPGIPRPPSLNLPQPVHDLTAARIGQTVELHFTVPSRSTDKLPLRDPTLTTLFCREIEHRACVPIPASKRTITISAPVHEEAFTWTDTLPEELTRDSPRVLGYRVALFNEVGRSAGNSTPAFTAAGVAPIPVEGLRAEGSRLGIVLRWNPGSEGSGEVIVRREDLALSPPKDGNRGKSGSNPVAIVDLIAPPTTANSVSDRLLDTSAVLDKPYRYSALRRIAVQLGGRSVELRSAPSEGVEVTLHAVYPPLAPTGLTAAAFVSDGLAVDLVWQPVDEPGLIAPLAGYNLYREAVDSKGQKSDRAKLNPSPLAVPAFRDSLAVASQRYRYSVTAVDVKGNESAAATVLLEPERP